MERKDRYAAIEASRLARRPGEVDHWPELAAISAEQLDLARAAEQSVIALRAVLSQVAPSPAWRAELAEMTAAALSAAKGVVSRETWAYGWRLVYFAREKPR